MTNIIIVSAIVAVIMMSATATAFNPYFFDFPQFISEMVEYLDTILPIRSWTMGGLTVTGNLTLNGIMFTPSEHSYGVSTTVQTPTAKDVWQNITYNMSVGDQERLMFENNNQTIVADVRGHYTITLGTFTIDSSPSPSAFVAFRITKNGEQLEGSYVQIKMRLQNALRFQEHTTHLTDVEVGDKFNTQWITSDEDVSLDSTATFTDRQKTTAYIYIQRISGMEW